MAAGLENDLSVEVSNGHYGRVGRYTKDDGIGRPNYVFPKPMMHPLQNGRNLCSMGKRRGEERRAGRLKVFSWNIGGLSIGQLDELLAWAEETSYDLVFVQETRWRQECTWETNSFCAYIAVKISWGIPGVVYFFLLQNELPPRRLCDGHPSFQAESCMYVFKTHMVPWI